MGVSLLLTFKFNIFYIGNLITIRTLFLILLKVSIFLESGTTATSPACGISINNDLNDQQPLLLKTKPGKKIFPSPTIGYDKIPFNENETIEIYCPGGTVIVQGESTELNSTIARCSKGNFVVTNKKPVPFHSITCSKQPKDSARFTGKTCLKNYKEFEIGYIYKSKFLTLITGCFDTVKLSTLYTTSQIPKTIDGYQSAHPRPSYWTQGPFYNLTGIDNLFRRNSQRSTINSLVGLDESSTKYISEIGDYYLSRGHLTPKADFLFGFQQKTTFYFANAVPQWQTFNNRNWKILENDIRNLASSRRLNLQVTTGPFEILTFPHESTGKKIKLYLYVSGNTKKIPIPKYIWKVVYDKKSKAGVAFVGLNIPYIEDTQEYTICKNVCDKLSYSSLASDYRNKGYVYCCEVDDLRKTVDTIPSFVVNALLV